MLSDETIIVPPGSTVNPVFTLISQTLRFNCGERTRPERTMSGVVREVAESFVPVERLS